MDSLIKDEDFVEMLAIIGAFDFDVGATRKYLKAKEMPEKSIVEQMNIDFLKLTPTERQEFICLMAESITSSEFLDMQESLSYSDSSEVLKFHANRFSEFLLPLMLKFAIELVNTDSLDEQSLRERCVGSIASLVEGASINERKTLENKRNRQPSEENIRRNVKICDMRVDGMSQGQIAKQYGKTDTWVRNIERDELKWRRLLRKIRPEPTS